MSPPDSRRPPLQRSGEDRILAGVCGGLAASFETDVRFVRGGFVAASLLFGIGAIVYFAFWLILPDPRSYGRTGLRTFVVNLAAICAVWAALVTLAIAASALAMFGLGGLVAGLAAAALVAALLAQRRAWPGWVLLPVAALTVPALVVTASDVRINRQFSDIVVAPVSAADLSSRGYETGLGAMLLDLRETRLPTSGDVRLRVDAGIRRTIVALPANRCVRVEVDFRVNPRPREVARIVSDRLWLPQQEVIAFGVSAGGIGFGATAEGRLTGPDAARSQSAPTLRIEFRSGGGSLYVRDYPDWVDPRTDPNWPGFPVTLEPRPDTTGVPRRAAAELIEHWRERRRDQVRSKRAIDRLMPGPCADRVDRGR